MEAMRGGLIVEFTTREKELLSGVVLEKLQSLHRMKGEVSDFPEAQQKVDEAIQELKKLNDKLCGI